MPQLRGNVPLFRAYQKVLERETLTTSSTWKTYFNGAREGNIKGLAVKSFHIDEEY
jgi:hypothetical protein